MTTGERIKTFRKHKGLTQKELAERMGVAPQTLAQWENNLRNPKYETLNRIAKELEISYLDLVEDADDMIVHSIEEDLPLKDFYKKELITAFEKLNFGGKEKTIEYAEMLNEIPRFQNPPALAEDQDGENADDTPQEGD